MRSTVLILAGLFALALVLFANTINARKDPGEYREAVMKDEPMPQVIQGLVDDVSKVTSPVTSPKKNHCSTTPTNSRTFQPTPNDDDKLKAKGSFRNDFEPRPSATAYTNNDEMEKEKYFLKDFESRPSATAYADNDEMKEGKSFVKNFEPRPNLSAYTDNSDMEKEKSFVKDFDNKEMKEEKSFTKEFEPRPNLSAYNDDAVGVEAIKESH
ncbi:UNVERIFIED_CONTAM: hypothetical protein Sradi_2804700 [Sesamum radiatum]|uniref:Organ-specific protein S2 n=1 Tax=Sesamum radiatum TaxID=300843 RepID=A0AAW2RVB1_SESRA